MTTIKVSDVKLGDWILSEPFRQPVEIVSIERVRIRDTLTMVTLKGQGLGSVWRPVSVYEVTLEELDEVVQVDRPTMNVCACDQVSNGDGNACRIHVACDEHCGALLKPTTHRDIKAAYLHWRHHRNNGCSHGRTS